LQAYGKSLPDLFASFFILLSLSPLPKLFSWSCSVHKLFPKENRWFELSVQAALTTWLLISWSSSRRLPCCALSKRVGLWEVTNARDINSDSSGKGNQSKPSEVIPSLRFFISSVSEPFRLDYRSGPLCVCVCVCVYVCVCVLCPLCVSLVSDLCPVCVLSVSFCS
jgi:hypothetical protein